MIKKRTFALCLFVFGCIAGLRAQESLVNTLPDQNFVKGSELYEKQKYAVAQDFFQKVIDDPATSNSEVRASAEYYVSMCAMKLFNPDAASLITKFIEENPGNGKINEACFNMAHFLYSNKKYSKARDWFERVKVAQLSQDQSSEYHFERGYCYFILQDYEKARVQFFEIKDIDTRYSAPALYYYSHIAYMQNNYETALDGFLRLRDDETFAPIVPYYITQIYFLQQKYDKVVSYAPQLLDSVVEKRMAEMSMIIGESYYHLGKYKESLPYFKKFAEKVRTMAPEDRYELAYAFFKAGDYTNAIKYFEPISIGQSKLSQNALYHLADCYLLTKDKQKARLAFYNAASMDFDPDIKENALFNYAVATYELSLSPFDEAVKGFNEYLKLYPNSNRSDEAYNYLMQAYMTTRNYKAALQSLEKIRKKDDKVRKAYQRIAFYRGLELYNNQQYDDAIDMFDKSLKYQEFDDALAARSYYWEGESYYRLQNYLKANEMYNKFRTYPAAANLKEYALVNYNIAYTWFNMKQYDKAMDWFRRFTGSAEHNGQNLAADAYNRIGDCYFMKQSYWVAIENYEKAIDMHVADADYSLFQKAFSLGLVNRPRKKVTFLNQLLQEYPRSSYVDDALYELGRAYVTLNDNDHAIHSFQTLIKNYPKSGYVPKSWLQLGLIYYNMGKTDEAIASYKKVEDQFPGSPESSDALNGLKNVYVGNNDVDTYFQYLKSKGENADLRVSEQDSLTYSAAENVYMSGDCTRATRQFREYLSKFPGGSFVLNAHFYLADCAQKNNKPDSALVDYENVIAGPHTMFTEQALVAAASIYISKNEYAKALVLYKQLETEAEIRSNVVLAKTGVMRCDFQLNNFADAIADAQALLQSDNVSEELQREAHYVLAKSYLGMNNTDEALKELKRVAVDMKSEEGAECKYLLAKLYYDQNQKDKSQKEIMDFIKKNTPYQYWLGKSFILLSEIYADRNDKFQAISTLKSIMDYYENNDDGIKAEAKAKHDSLVVQNDSLQVTEKPQDIEVGIDKQKKP